MAIRINSENQNRRIRIKLEKTDKAAKASLKNLKKDNCELNIVFISSQKMRVFNRKYFGKDKTTDVIAFPAGKASFKGQGSGVRGNVFLGDIAISTDRAKRNTKTYGTFLIEETVLYVIHGILHLLGYEDTSNRKRALMKKKENELFKNIKRFL